MSYQLDYTGTEINKKLESCELIKPMKTIFNLVYPVGSIYMSINSTSPAVLFGGTWTQIKDTFLLAAGSTYTAGKTGGEATHKLTTAEMPSHTHTFTGTAASHSHTSKIFTNNNKQYTMSTSGIRLSSPPWVDITTASDITTAGSTNGDICGTTSDTSITPKGTNASTGSSAAHNNMPPYLVVYMWKRTA